MLPLGVGVQLIFGAPLGSMAGSKTAPLWCRQALCRGLALLPGFAGASSLFVDCPSRDFFRSSAAATFFFLRFLDVLVLTVALGIPVLLAWIAILLARCFSWHGKIPCQ